MKNVINDSTIAKIDQQSVEAICYHVKQTGLSTAVILTTRTSNIHTVEYLRLMYAAGDDPLRATVINVLCIDPLIPPTVETLIGRRWKNQIESQSIIAPTEMKTRTVICPLYN